MLAKETKLNLLLLFISFSSIILFMALNPLWYQFNYLQDDTYSKFESPEIVDTQTRNLIQFFVLWKPLDDVYWSQKEIRHMEDVRVLFTILGVLLFISLLSLLLNPLLNLNLHGYLKLLGTTILILFITIFFFSYFWNNIFHQVLFFNDYWIMDPSDLSYYLFPETFFIRSILLLNIFLLFQLILFNYILRKKKE